MSPASVNSRDSCSAKGPFASVLGLWTCSEVVSSRARVKIQSRVMSIGGGGRADQEAFSLACTIIKLDNHFRICGSFDQTQNLTRVQSNAGTVKHRLQPFGELWLPVGIDRYHRRHSFGHARPLEQGSDSGVVSHSEHSG